jgi:hypothetical protein
MTKKRRKFVATSRKFPPAFEGVKTWLDGVDGSNDGAMKTVLAKSKMESGLAPERSAG